jgi:hypothetical protein
MNPELWKSLEGQALWLLEHADQLPPREPLQGMALQLRVWRYPRSGAHVSWSVILSVREFRAKRAVVREVVWDRLADWKQRMAPLEALKRRQILAPSIRSRDAEVNWADLEPFLDRVGGLRSPTPPLLPRVPSKEDAFGLEGYRSMAHVRLQWSGKGPRGWGDTVAWIGHLRQTLVRSMRERDREARRG